MLEAALALARRGFRVFPIAPGQKDPPLFKGWNNSATTNEAVIRAWWAATPQANPGIYTGDLLVIDVDCKNGHSGYTTLLTLPGDLPSTYEQRTPSGGAHLVFANATGVKIPNRVRFLPGLDTRGSGGYIVGAGARVELGTYSGNSSSVAPAPAWLVELVCSRVSAASPRTEVPADANINEEAATSQARQMLAQWPVVPDGQRDEIAFKAACAVRDLGLSEARAAAVVVEGFRADPPFPEDQIRRKVESAYRRAQNARGATAPEADFAAQPAAPMATPPPDGTAPGSPVDAAIAEMNKHYAYALAGSTGNILHFTTDAYAKLETLFLSTKTFAELNASKLVRFPGAARPRPLTEVWMASPQRRTYRGVVFAPEERIDPSFYNLWRGFAVTPLGAGETASPRATLALQRFLEHAQENVCKGEGELFKYLISYFAHAVQRPFEKPQVALVFRGAKGVGKDTLVDTFGALLGPHYINTPKRRQVLGDFNSALESCLALNLNEAFWHGDKSVNSVMQDLITGRRHLIERKGQEPYFVTNLLRVFLIGNEDTIVHASWDERRYQCFEVSAGRRGQPRYFQELREGMEAGGYRALLRYLLDWRLDGFNANEALKTTMLYEQKLEGVNPLHRWWRESLEEGRLLQYDEGGAGWPERVDKEALRIAFRRYRKDRDIGGWELQNIWIGRRLREACPSLDTKQKRIDHGRPVNEYRIPPLGVARLEWDTFIGHAADWGA